MQILPVLDLKDGFVVRGIAGRRDEYRPVESQLTDSALPLDIALSFRQHFELSEIYLADLNAIAGERSALETYQTLREHGFRLWIDAGIHNLADVERDLIHENDQLLVGLETLESPDALHEIRTTVGDRVVFSLDLKDGQPLGNVNQWQGKEALAIAKQAIALGVSRILILDLAKVGVGEGTGTQNLCRELIATFPHVQVGAGGGLRSREDLSQLRDIGVSFVLIASALHDGTLTVNDLK